MDSAIEGLIQAVRQRLAYGLGPADLGDLVEAHGSDAVFLAYHAALILEQP